MAGKVAQEKERQAAELELLRLTQMERMADKAQETQLALAQIDVNKEEAQNPNLFVSGWRPAMGWVCVGSFSYIFVFGPIITQITSYFGTPVSLPPVDINNMIYILGGMLGLGGLRTYERVKGVIPPGK